LLIAVPFSHGPARPGAHKGYSKKQMAGTSPAMRKLSDLAERAAQAIGASGNESCSRARHSLVT